MTRTRRRSREEIKGGRIRTQKTKKKSQNKMTTPKNKTGVLDGVLDARVSAGDERESGKDLCV